MVKMKTKKTIKIGIGFISIFAVVCIALMLICNQIVVSNAEGKVFSDIDSIKYNKVGLLLGTTPQARIGRITNYFFIYRIDAAEQLYKAGKIEKILISGDENSLDGINEPECMRDSLVARGVPADSIILDGKGYRTICSVVNANKVYGLKSFTIISQEFHNERAIYQAEHLGLDVENIQAYNAKMPKSRRAFLTTIREYFARVKMFIDLAMYKDSEEISILQKIFISPEKMWIEQQHTKFLNEKTGLRAITINMQIYKGDSIIQRITHSDERNEWYETPLDSAKLMDINFDGKEDIVMRYDGGGAHGSFGYECYLWDDDISKFIPDTTLQQLFNPTFLPEEKFVFCYTGAAMYGYWERWDYRKGGFVKTGILNLDVEIGGKENDVIPVLKYTEAALVNGKMKTIHKNVNKDNISSFWNLVYKNMQGVENL